MTEKEIAAHVLNNGAWRFAAAIENKEDRVLFLRLDALMYSHTMGQMTSEDCSYWKQYYIDLWRTEKYGQNPEQ